MKSKLYIGYAVNEEVSNSNRSYGTRSQFNGQLYVLQFVTLFIGRKDLPIIFLFYGTGFPKSVFQKRTVIRGQMCTSREDTIFRRLFVGEFEKVLGTHAYGQIGMQF